MLFSLYYNKSKKRLFFYKALSTEEDNPSTILTNDQTIFLGHVEGKYGYWIRYFYEEKTISHSRFCSGDSLIEGLLVFRMIEPEGSIIHCEEMNEMGFLS